VTAYRAVVLEHFRHPRNHGLLADATASHEGVNPLCGDRIRIQLRVERDVVADAKFTANACALCTASASLLTTHLTGMTTANALAVDIGWIHRALEGEPPAGRAKCALLPLDTLRRALSDLC
jgi:nitrogen fixation NifU-like protein